MFLSSYLTPFKRRFISARWSALRRAYSTRRMEVELSEKEEEICTLLDNCTKYLKSEHGIETSCRIAGGWVRDKLLGLHSNDIDIALSNMMGVPFAEHLLAFSKSKGMAVGKVSKIESNPDQSKHLETARFTVLDTEMDFVNLRSEEYAESSRIPTQVAFGTPLQDALRRDITINALFYNVHSRQVEDFVGKGLSDLKHGIIRTPLPPKVTFLDDPLRVIRCVRFASRYNFKMEPELEEAASDSVVKAALESKVSRERVGEELVKMLKGRDPLLSIQLICKLDLYHSVFSILPSAISSTLSASPDSPTSAIAAAGILRSILNPDTVTSIALPRVHPTLLTEVIRDSTCSSRLYLAAALTPYANISYSDKKKRVLPGVEAIIRESIKVGTQNHFLDGVPALFAASNLIKRPDLNGQRFQVGPQRVKIGLLLRDKAVHNPNTGSHWTTSILFSLIQELVPHYDITKNAWNDATAAASIVTLYNDFVTKIEELDLTSAAEAKPILDGREVVGILGASKPGPWTGCVLNSIMEWQLEHKDGTKDQCIEWLRKEVEAGRIEVETSSSSEKPKKKPRLS